VTERFVLDASALLNILLDEPGRDRVNQIVDGCRIHAVNLAEVLGRLVSGGMPPGKAASALADLYLALNEGFGGGDLGLSLADCVCLPTAVRLGAVAVTADRRWKKLDGAVVMNATIHVELIR
jgi:PIN domain nuclease of toxin-antitoxin system